MPKEKTIEERKADTISALAEKTPMPLDEATAMFEEVLQAFSKNKTPDEAVLSTIQFFSYGLAAIDEENKPKGIGTQLKNLLRRRGEAPEAQQR